MIPPIRDRAQARRVFVLQCWKWIFLFILTAAFAGVRAHAQSQPATLTPAAVSDNAPTSDSSITDSSVEALDRARASVERIFAHSADMVCTESVNQTILESDGRMAYQEHSRFNYRLKTEMSGKSLKFVETREKLEAAFRDPSRTVLITDGFGNLLLILHPEYSASYTFQAAGFEVIAGVSTLKFDFKAIPGASSPVMLEIRGQNYSVDLDGTVWIEPRSGNVVKLIASSSASMDDFGIDSMRSEIEYLPVELHNPEESYWMPASAVIDVETEHRRLRNIHNFTAYRRFEAPGTLEERAGNVDAPINEK